MKCTAAPAVLSYEQRGCMQLAEGCSSDNQRVIRVNCIQIKGLRWSTDRQTDGILKVAV